MNRNIGDKYVYSRYRSCFALAPQSSDRQTQADREYTRILLENPALRKKRLRQDLRIAMIALTQNAIVVTRNQRDFSQIPGLQIVEWSSP